MIDLQFNKESDNREGDLPNSSSVDFTESKRAVEVPGATDYVKFIFQPSNPAEPLLDFNAKIFNASILQSSASEVIDKMRQAKVSSASIGSFLQKVCAAFGFPTTIANDDSDTDRVLSLTEQRAQDLSDAFGDQEVEGDQGAYDLD